MVELNAKLIMKKSLPRVLKAAVWGTLTLISVYYLPLMLIPQELTQNVLPFDYNAQLIEFTIIAVFFSVATTLFAETLLGYSFGIARSLVIIAYFFAISDGGIIDLTVPFSEITINLTVDITVLLLMLVSVSLLDIARNLLHVINHLTSKSNDPSIV